MVDEQTDELPDMFYYVPSSLCKTVKLSTSKTVEWRSALLNAGHRVSQTHCEPSGVYTEPFFLPSSTVHNHAVVII
jgi:tRNA G26 N,N-dimethylase Trm1